MVRKTYSTLVAIALAAVVMVGCGKEDVSDLTGTWNEKSGEVETKLAAVQAKNTELQGRLSSIQISNPADSTMVTERAALETMLQNNMTKVSEIETQLKTNAAKRDSLNQAGLARAEYEAAWKGAETEYASAMTALDEIEKQNNEISDRLDKMNKPAETNAVDTAAANNNGTNMKSDTAVLVDDKKVDASAKKADETKTDEKKPAESN